MKDLTTMETEKNSVVEGRWDAIESHGADFLKNSQVLSNLPCIL